MKNYSLFFALFILFCSNGQAQQLTNILDATVEHDIGYGNSWIEQGDFYYFITKRTVGAVNTITQLAASQYILNKYDKNSLQRLAWKVIAGDTLQNDTVVSYPATMHLKNNILYLTYTKSWVKDSITDNGLYFQRLDTGFNALLPEKRIDVYPIYSPSLGAESPIDNGRYFLCYVTTFDPPLPSYYIVLDSLGNVLLRGKPGADTINHVPHMQGFADMGNHTYMEPGYFMAGMEPNALSSNNIGWCLVNDSMQILDTFFYKQGLVQSIIPMSLGQTTPKLIALPTGSLVLGSTTTLSSFPGTAAYNYPLITKHTAASRYGVDKYLSFPPLDNNDLGHTIGYAPYAVVYNAFDHNLYYASISHDNLGYCTDNLYYGYLDVISVDTNLNFRWRKIFKLNHTCSSINLVAACDGRNGVIAGGSTNAVDSVEPLQWVYYISDSTVSDTIAATTSISAIQVNSEKWLSVYPNPATDKVRIACTTGLLKQVDLYDFSGRLLLSQFPNKQSATIDISHLTSGIYLLKCRDQDDRLFVRKLTKE